MFLKQSTSISFAIGPFLDETDGKTAETGLTITQPDIRLKKNDGDWAQKNASQTLTHEEAGWYEVTLDETDTNTVGQLVVAVHESGALPVWRHFTVLEEAVYDALFAASAAGYQVPIWAAANSTVNLSATTIKTVTDVEADTVDIQSRLPAALTSGRMDASVGAMAANTVTALALASDAVTEIQSGLSTLDAGEVRNAVGLASANLDTQLDALPTAAEITTNILAGTCDGVAVSKILEVLLAAMAGKVSVSSSGGVSTLTYKKRDGSTTSFTTVVTESDNTRATTGALS